jgi:hypothetical protein
MRDFWIQIACVLSMLTAPVTAQQPVRTNPPVPSAEVSFVYMINCGGEFVRLQLPSSDVAAQWDLSRTNTALLPTGNLQGCVVSNAHFDSANSVVYGFVPRELRPALDGTRHYRLAALRLPAFEQLGFADLPAALNTPPALLVTPDGSRILISYHEPPKTLAGDAAGVGVVETYSGSLQKVRTLRSDTDPGAYASAAFSERALFGPDGAIYDGYARIRLTSNGFVREKLDPLAAIPEPQRTRVRQQHPSEPALPNEYGPTASGRAIVVLGDVAPRMNAAFIVDLASSQLLATLQVPADALIDLAPKGDIVLLEKAGVKKVGPRSESRIFKTGDLLVYRVDSPGTPREIQNALLAGFESRVACYQPNGELLLYTANRRLYQIGVAKASVEVVKSLFAPYEPTFCTFAQH